MEMGNKSLGGTLIEGGREGIEYPTVYLQDKDAEVVGDHEIGDEVMMTGKVRISSISKDADGSHSARFEILEMKLAEKDKPAAADKMYPSVAKD